MKCPSCCSCKCRLSPFLIQILSIAASAFCIFFSIFSFVSFDLLRLVINLYILLFAVLALLADIRAFWFFGYIKFIYTAFGRGLLYVFIGLLMLTSSLFNVISGCSLVVVGILYFVFARLFGGVPKPLLQRNLDELPLNTELHFVNLDEDGARTITATTSPGMV